MLPTSQPHPFDSRSRFTAVLSAMLVLGAAAMGCGPKDDSADTDDTEVSLPTSIAVTASGLPLVQGVGGTSGSRRSPANWCEEPGVDVGAGTPTHLAALAPITDPNGYARLPQVVRLDGGTCAVAGAIAAPDADAFATGFGGPVLGHEDDEWEWSAGLMLRVVESGSEVWLFQNAGRGFWRIASNGTATHSTAIAGFPAGAASDGAGGAWVATLAEADQEGSAVAPTRLHHLTPAGTIDDTVDLDLDAFQSGFEGGDDDGRIGTFVSQALAVGDDGRVWMLHSGLRLLLVVDPTTDSVTPHTLDVWYPTGLAWSGSSNLLIVAGMHMQEDLTVLQAPKLYHFEEATGDLTAVLGLPAPAGGWNLSSGFEGDGDTDVNGRIPLHIWFDLVAAGETTLVADPAHGRVLEAE